jgi:hypothetical protein
MEAIDQLGDHDDVVKVLRELERRVASVTFDANDEQSIEAAIATVDDEVDERLLPFGAYSGVREIADELKAKAAQNIRLRAQQARSAER